MHRAIVAACVGTALTFAGLALVGVPLAGGIALLAALCVPMEGAACIGDRIWLAARGC